MSAFVKIYGLILRSSVWQQPLPTKVVWITMLALADGDGVVEASIPGLAATAGVTIEECERALACFLAPDKYSGSDVEEGRRIRERRGGWLIINHRYYRELRTEKHAKDAARLAAKRARDVSATNATVAQSKRDCRAEAEAEIRSISSSSPPATPDAPAALDAPKPDETAKRVAEVFACWQTEHGKARSKLDTKRRARIKARLAEGFTAEQLCKAIRGAKRDSFLMGQDPNAKRTFDGLETLLRDAAQVERLCDLHDGKSRPSGSQRPSSGGSSFDAERVL